MGEFGLYTLRNTIIKAAKNYHKNYTKIRLGDCAKDGGQEEV